MQDYEAADCPMSEPFRAKIGITHIFSLSFLSGIYHPDNIRTPHARY